MPYLDVQFAKLVSCDCNLSYNKETPLIRVNLVHVIAQVLTNLANRTQT